MKLKDPVMIELSLPGDPPADAPKPTHYRITVERLDGFGVTEIEAQTCMSMYCMQAAMGQIRRTKRSKVGK